MAVVDSEVAALATMAAEVTAAADSAVDALEEEEALPAVSEVVLVGDIMEVSGAVADSVAAGSAVVLVAVTMVEALVVAAVVIMVGDSAEVTVAVEATAGVAAELLMWTNRRSLTNSVMPRKAPTAPALDRKPLTVAVGYKAPTPSPLLTEFRGK